MTSNGKRVLVVDDEDVVCRSYERVLTQAGFDVAKAHSGAEALDRVRDRDYDVMLADLKMPGMDGLEVIEQLRGSNPGMPVVVITGYPSQDTLREAARLGVADYLTKPVAPDVLTEATMQAVTTPPWTRSKSAPQAAAEKLAEETQLPRKLPPGPLLWPEQPTTVPTPPVAKEAVKQAVTEEVVAEEGEPVGVLRTAGKLLAAPVVSLAYVMFLPLLGLAMFGAFAVKAVYEKVGGR